MFAAMLLVPVLVVDMVSPGLDHLLVVWLGSLVATGAAPKLAKRLARRPAVRARGPA